MGFALRVCNSLDRGVKWGKIVENYQKRRKT